MAVADEEYLFDEWTDDAGIIADVNSAITTVVMNGDYAVTNKFFNPEGRGKPWQLRITSHLT